MQRNFHPRIYPDLIYLNRNIGSKVIRIRLIKLYHEYKIILLPRLLSKARSVVRGKDEGNENLGKLVLERSSSRFSIFNPVTIWSVIISRDRYKPHLDPSHRFAAVVIDVDVHGDRVAVRVDGAIQPRLQTHAAVAQQERFLHRGAWGRALWKRSFGKYWKLFHFAISFRLKIYLCKWTFIQIFIWRIKFCSRIYRCCQTFHLVISLIVSRLIARVEGIRG